MELTHHADGLPAEYASKAPVTLLGAAHYWAERAKEAESQVGPLRARATRWRLVGAVGLVVGAIPWIDLVVQWVRA